MNVLSVARVSSSVSIEDVQPQRSDATQLALCPCGFNKCRFSWRSHLLIVDLVSVLVPPGNTVPPVYKLFVGMNADAPSGRGYCPGDDRGVLSQSKVRKPDGKTSQEKIHLVQ